MGGTHVYVTDPKLVEEVVETENELVRAADSSLGLWYITQKSVTTALPPEHEAIRMAYFRAQKPAALAQYLPATHEAVKGNLEQAAGL